MPRHSRLLALVAVLIAIGAAACGDDTTGPTPAPEVEFAATGSHRYLRCTRMPPAVAMALVGPNGGTLRANRHVLDIPKGALSQYTWITMKAPSDTINAVIFEPEGLRFNSGYLAQLKLDYTNCPSAALYNKKIVYADDRMNVLEVLGTWEDKGNYDIITRLGHFSRYAIWF